MLIDETSRYAELRALLEWTIIAIGIQVCDWALCFGRSRSIGWVIDKLNGSNRTHRRIMVRVYGRDGLEFTPSSAGCGGSRDRRCFDFLK